jgi:hypothetical protein
LGVLAPGAAVLAVHGTSISYPFFYDDYGWLALPDHAGWLGALMTPESGASIYRPGLGLWFAGTRAMFGISAVPFHVFALAFLIAAALAVRWLALELGIGNLAATATGALYGAFAPLAVTTIWASAAGSSLAVALAVASIALVCRPSARRQIVAAALLAAAILVRDATVVAPAVAGLVLAARSPDREGVKTALRSTWGLWVVAVAYLTMRAALVAVGGNTGPYAVNLLGGHLPSNLLDLMQHVSWLGLRSALLGEIVERDLVGGVSILRAWDVVLWLSIFGAAAWALRRRYLLPLAGIAWFFVSLSPVLVLPNHPMEPYYLDMAAVGLALTVGSLCSMARLTPAVTAVAVGAFILVQVAAVQLFQHEWNNSEGVRRTEALQRIAATEQPRAGELVIVTHCPGDREWSRDGDLFRVLQNNPELRVRFEIVEPETC